MRRLPLVRHALLALLVFAAASPVFGQTAIPAPAAGVLKEIRVEPGQTVPINTVVGVIVSRRGGVMGMVAGGGVGRSVGVRAGRHHAEHRQPADEHGARHEERSRHRPAGRIVGC